MNESWNARLEKLEAAVIKAALDLFEHMGSAGAFKLPIKATNPEIFVVAGSEKAVLNLVDSGIPVICSGCGGEINPDYGKCRRCD